MQTGTKRALIIVAVVVIALAVAGYYFLHAPSHPSTTSNAPPLIPLGVAPAGPPPDVLSLLPEGAPIIAFGDVHTLRDSAFVSDLSALAPTPEQSKDYRDFVRETGFDYSKDLDRFAADVWIDPNRPLPDGSPRISLVTIADGKFDQAKISAYILRNRGAVTKHGNADVYEMPSGIPGEKISLAFLAEGRIALSQGQSLDAVLAKSSKASLDAATRDRIARVNGATVFAVAHTDDLPKLIAIPGIQSGQLNRILKSIRNLSLAAHPNGDKLTTAIEADCDSTANALQLGALLETLRIFGRAALADPKTRAQLRPDDAAALDTLLQIASVSREGHLVRIRADIPADILKPKKEVTSDK